MRLTLAIAFLLAGCTPHREPSTASRHWTVMGTLATVTLAPEAAGRLDEAHALVRDHFAAIDQTFSPFRTDSVLRRLNEQAGGDPVAVDPDVAELIRAARDLSEITQGAFDPTVGPLLRLWGFRDNTPATVPDDAVIAATLSQTGWRHIRMIEREDGGSDVHLTRSGMQLDLGGIAKGYALDLAFEALRTAGFADFLIDLGGELRCLGRPRPGQAGWRIGVRHPLEPQHLLGSLLVTDGRAIATSGHYERFREIEGRRFAHILDPRDGRPVSGMAGVTVTAPTSLKADGASTALFVLGIEAGSDWLVDHPDVDALWVPDRLPLEIHLTPGMAAQFTPLAPFARSVRVLPLVGSGQRN